MAQRPAELRVWRLMIITVGQLQMVRALRPQMPVQLFR